MQSIPDTSGFLPVMETVREICFRAWRPWHLWLQTFRWPPCGDRLLRLLIYWCIWEDCGTGAGGCWKSRKYWGTLMEKSD